MRPRTESPRLVAHALLAAVVAGALASCTGGSPTIPSPLPEGSTSSAASPTPPAVPDSPPPLSGASSDTCEGGWETPADGSDRWNRPLRIIARTTGETGPLEVIDMRLFVGPESPPSDKGYLMHIQRWYVKLYAKDDLSFQGRFLVESRQFGSGVVAVAAYDTSGFTSPEWVGFQWKAADRTRRVYPTLPGRWEGVAYDFVRGGEGLDLPGLPAAMAGCMDGT